MAQTVPAFTESTKPVSLEELEVAGHIVEVGEPMSLEEYQKLKLYELMEGRASESSVTLEELERAGHIVEVGEPMSLEEFQKEKLPELMAGIEAYKSKDTITEDDKHFLYSKYMDAFGSVNPVAYTVFKTTILPKLVGEKITTTEGGLFNWMARNTSDWLVSHITESALYDRTIGQLNRLKETLTVDFGISEALHFPISIGKIIVSIWSILMFREIWEMLPSGGEIGTIAKYGLGIALAFFIPYIIAP
jgi:hypothetical protein